MHTSVAALFDDAKDCPWTRCARKRVAHIQLVGVDAYLREQRELGE